MVEMTIYGVSFDLVERCSGYLGAGFTEFIVYVGAGKGEADGTAAAELLPQLRSLG